MKTKVIRWLLFLFVLFSIALAFLYRDQLDTQALKQWIDNAGLAGPLVFMFVYILGTLLFFPGSILTLAGGALFGPFLGTLYNLVAATVGALFAFLLARYWFGDWVKHKTEGKLKQLSDGVEKEGWRFIAFVRLVPLFPFNLLNYALGVTRISTSHYVITSFITMLPGAFAYTYLGYAGGELVAGDPDLNHKIQIGTIAIALLATVAFLPGIVSRLRQRPGLSIPELKQKLKSQEVFLLLDVRNPDEFGVEQNPIDKTINIPLNDLPGRTDELLDYLEKPILLISQSDKQSARAARLLTRKGYADVHVIEGGVTGWNLAKNEN